MGRGAGVNALASFLSKRSKVAKLREEAARVDEDFARQERRLQAELDALRMRNRIASSERVLARFSIEVPPKVNA